MKIGLLGFCFQDENKGCEALTYSFLGILENIYPCGLEVVNLSSNNLGIVPKYFPSIKFSSERLRIKDIKLNNIKLLKKLDYVFDITYGDGFSDIYNTKFVFLTTLQKMFVIISDCPLILLPQTYGPFKNKWLECFAAFVIKRSKRVYSRDYLSTEYVKKLTSRTAIEATDLAFALPYTKGKSGYKTKIGLNVSGLLWNGGFPGNSNQFELSVDYPVYIKTLIETLISCVEYEVHIIPHVLELYEESHDGDIAVCQQLKREYSELIGVPIFNTPIEAKSYISNMDVFIGARMHSTIAAFSSGVATIPFSYSRKFAGLYGSLDYKYIINGCSLTTEEALVLTLNYIDSKGELSNCIERSMNKVISRLGDFKVDLKKCMVTKRK